MKEQKCSTSSVVNYISCRAFVFYTKSRTNSMDNGNINAFVPVETPINTGTETIDLFYLT